MVNGRFPPAIDGIVPVPVPVPVFRTLSLETVVMNTRVRDRIAVQCITKMSTVVVYLRSMTLMESLFPIALVNFKEVSLIDEAPDLQLNAPSKKTLSRLLSSSGMFAFLDKLVAAYKLILTKINTNTPASYHFFLCLTFVLVSHPPPHYRTRVSTTCCSCSVR